MLVLALENVLILNNYFLQNYNINSAPKKFCLKANSFWKVREVIIISDS